MTPWITQIILHSKVETQMLLLATVLFVLLSPGVLLTLPPIGGKVWMSGKTSLLAVAVHAVVFYVLLSMRRSIPVLNVVFEGFSAADGADCKEHTDCASGMCGPDKKCAPKKA